MPLTLKLGKTEYQIDDLTWGQVGDMQQEFFSLPLDAAPRVRHDAYRSILATALAESYPGTTAETLKKARGCTIQVVDRATLEVLSFAGIITLSPAKASEEGPGAGKENAQP